MAAIPPVGYNLYHYRALLPPLKEVFERYVGIAPGRTLVFRNRNSKVVYFLEGGLELELPDGTRHAIHAGDVTATDEVWTVRYRSRLPGREARIHALVLHFDQGWMTDRPDRVLHAHESAMIRAIRGRLRGFQYFPGAVAQGSARVLLDRFRSLLNDRRSLTPAWKVSSLALSLVSELVDYFPPAPEEAEAAPAFKGEAAFRHARDYILENFSAKLTLGQIAWQVRLSGEHLERLFKKHARHTVFEFLDRTRLDRARELLLTTDLPVQQIAIQCGFSSSTLFGRHFKARLGQTPLNFRLESRNAERFTASNVQPTPAAALR